VTDTYEYLNGFGGYKEYVFHVQLPSLQLTALLQE
jgi:hypothetical protein